LFLTLLVDYKSFFFLPVPPFLRSSNFGHSQFRGCKNSVLNGCRRMWFSYGPFSTLFPILSNLVFVSLSQQPHSPFPSGMASWEKCLPPFPLCEVFPFLFPHCHFFRPRISLCSSSLLDLSFLLSDNGGPAQNLRDLQLAFSISASMACFWKLFFWLPFNSPSGRTDTGADLVLSVLKKPSCALRRGQWLRFPPPFNAHELCNRTLNLHREGHTIILINTHTRHPKLLPSFFFNSSLVRSVFLDGFSYQLMRLGPEANRLRLPVLLWSDPPPLPFDFLTAPHDHGAALIFAVPARAPPPPLAPVWLS